MEEKKKETADLEKEKTHPVPVDKENVNQRIKVSREETDSCFDKGPIHM